jgi:hypothetical protein
MASGCTSAETRVLVPLPLEREAMQLRVGSVDKRFGLPCPLALKTHKRNQIVIL